MQRADAGEASSDDDNVEIIVRVTVSIGLHPIDGLGIHWDGCHIKSRFQSS